MSQMTFSDYEYSLRKRKTKREEFLDIICINIDSCVSGTPCCIYRQTV